MKPPPFDTVAKGYDAVFTRQPLGQWLRGRVWEHLEHTFHPGDHLLELGCGTGEDAVRLARRGIRLTATDASPAMLDVAARKAAIQGVQDQLRFARLDLATLSSAPAQLPAFPTAPTRYDGAFSNFGVLNCLPDRRPLAAALATSLPSGSRVVLVVMGPLCPWEWIWYLAHGQVRTAFRRFRPGTMARLDDGTPLRVWYPSPRRLRREFGAFFRHVQTVGIGVLLPPSFASHVVERWPRIFARLNALERRVSTTGPGAWLNDHYLMILERQ